MKGLADALPLKRYTISSYPVASLVGLYRGLEWVLECRKKNGYCYHWTVDCLFPSPLHLVIYSESLALPSRRLLSMQELHAEEPDFDARYLVFSNDPERAELAVNPMVQGTLTALADVQVCIECDRDGLRATLVSKELFPLATLTTMTELFASMLHGLVHSKPR